MLKVDIIYKRCHKWGLVEKVNKFAIQITVSMDLIESIRNENRFRLTQIKKKKIHPLTSTETIIFAILCFVIQNLSQWFVRSLEILTLHVMLRFEHYLKEHYTKSIIRCTRAKWQQLVYNASLFMTVN